MRMGERKPHRKLLSKIVCKMPGINVVVHILQFYFYVYKAEISRVDSHG